MKKVLVFGTFDIVHPGHIHMLREAKEYGDYLVVVVARDNTVEEVKQKKPINDQEMRKRNVEALGLADRVRLGYEGDKHQVVLEENPQVVALGYDQKFFIEDLEKALESSAKIVRLAPYIPEKYKSSKLRPNQGE